MWQPFHKILLGRNGNSISKYQYWIWSTMVVLELFVRDFQSKTLNECQ